MSFTEIFGVFFIGYSIGLIVAGPQPSGPTATRGPGFIPVRRFGGNPFASGGIPFTTGAALAFIVFLFRVDILSRLSNAQSGRSVAAIVGADATVVEPIPAGGVGQITYLDMRGNRVGVMAAADVDLPAGTRVRIVGTRGLNPLVVPE